jgi:hypothetical protein
MNAHYDTLNEPATPDYVLAVIRDLHRQQCQYHPCTDPDVSLSFDTTILDWRDACDLLEWRELGHAYNEIFRIHCSDADWCAALEPSDKKCLADVCELVARHAKRPRIRPVSLFGSTSPEAGAFLTVRALLHDAGADADEIAPSTPLAPYTRRYCPLFLGPIARLAPGVLPDVQIHTPLYDAAISGMGIGFLLMRLGFLMAWLFNVYVLIPLGGFVLLVCHAATWVTGQCLLPSSVEFGELRTFRDLATAIAKGGTA